VSSGASPETNGSGDELRSSALIDLSSVSPLDQTDNGPVVERLQTHLRTLVLDGTLKPGAVISQVELARALGVSRTPLREALRMLQEEGLIDAEPNRQARIAGFDPTELDTVYATRIALEGVAIALTAATADAALVGELDTMIAEMERFGSTGNEVEFHEVHRRFHRLVVSSAPVAFTKLMLTHQDRAERYWRLLTLVESAPHTRREREHREIVEAIRLRDGRMASAALARHLARTALTLMVQTAPEQDAPATRTALQLRTA
jgi:DNA-binding GntR family transcriptional regulator